MILIEEVYNFLREDVGCWQTPFCSAERKKGSLGAPNIISIIIGVSNIFLKCQNCPSFVLDVHERVVRKRLKDQIDPYVDILSIRKKLMDQLDLYVDILSIRINLIRKNLTD